MRRALPITQSHRRVPRRDDRWSRAVEGVKITCVDATESIESRNKAVVQRYWVAMGTRDWDGMRALLTDDAHYADIGTRLSDATGRDAVVDRVRTGLEPLSGYEQLPGANLVAEGDLVMTEHTERWHFHTGEVVDHPFVSVTQLRDGRICRWHDYSNIANLVENAPRWWLEHMKDAAARQR